VNVPKRWRVTTAGRPDGPASFERGRTPGCFRLKTLRSTEAGIVRFSWRNDGRGSQEQRELLGGLEERESPRGREAQESRRPWPDLNHRVSDAGYGFFHGSKPLRRGFKVREGFGLNRGSGGGWGDPLPTMGEEESSEGESPGALGAERGFRGCGELETVQRVAKP
jgi:hypothetical protein